MENVKNWKTFVQVRSNQLLTFDRPEEGFRCPSWRKPPTKKGYSGMVTKGTAKRIETAVDIFLQISPKRKVYNLILKKDTTFQLSFITLTIAALDEIPVSEGNEALKVWLQHFRRPWHKKKLSEPMTTYLWKAELQKRNQLHYHLCTNSWLHFAEIRRVWNDIQKKRGWLEDYKSKSGHYDPNSTDVHAIYKIRDVRRYLSKYIAKQEFRKSPANPEAGYPELLVPVALDGKIWGCSEDLKGKKRCTLEMDKWTYLSMKSATESDMLKLYESEHCKFYDNKSDGDITQFLSTTNLNNYKSWKTQF